MQTAEPEEDKVCETRRALSVHQPFSCPTDAAPPVLIPDESQEETRGPRGMPRRAEGRAEGGTSPGEGAGFDRLVRSLSEDGGGRPDARSFMQECPAPDDREVSLY
jgi:hypothetical protein